MKCITMISKLNFIILYPSCNKSNNVKCLSKSQWATREETIIISIYTLSDLGDLSNLIGSLSRTIQQCSPPSEWIMCELGVFPIFLENDLLKADRILGLTFFKARKDLEGFNTAVFNLLQLSFVLDELVTTPVYSGRRSRFVNPAFSNKKILAQKSKFTVLTRL